MSLFKRIAYYAGGFVIGIILLFFFLGGKKASCAYGPTARVLKNVRIKDRLFTDEASKVMLQHAIDTADISTILIEGDVVFSKSNTKLDSCKVYHIESDFKEKNIALLIQNCNKIATVKSITIE